MLQHIPDTRRPLPATSPWSVLIEVTDTLPVDLGPLLAEALSDAAAHGLVADATVAATEAQMAALWRLRESISEAQRIEGISIKHDVAVPVSCIPEFIARADEVLRTIYPAVRVVCFGHVGDGNLHYNLSMADAGYNAGFIAATPAVNRAVHDLVAELNGTISAEHGLGQLKRDEVLRYKSAEEMALMRTIKAALDPLGIMNPGKVV